LKFLGAPRWPSILSGPSDTHKHFCARRQVGHKVLDAHGIPGPVPSGDTAMYYWDLYMHAGISKLDLRVLLACPWPSIGKGSANAEELTRICITWYQEGHNKSYFIDVYTPSSLDRA
jgi:hypothetical protein